MNQDFVDLLRAFVEAEVRPLRPNAALVMKALAAFGAPLHDISETDFSREVITYQIGLPPGRADVLTQLTGLTFAEAWPGRVSASSADVNVPEIGLEAFVKNKRATGRLKDLADIDGLE